jgi:hypothetical protein
MTEVEYLTRTAKELENSFPMDLGRRFRNPEGCAFLNAIIGGIKGSEQRKKARKPQDASRWLATIEALLANLVAGHLNVVDRNRFVAVSFDRNTYNGTDISFASIIQCRDYLLGQGYIEIAVGYFRTDRSGVGDYGRRSRLRASPDLRQLMDANGINRRSLTRPVSDLIQIREQIHEVGATPQHVEESRVVLEAVNIRLAETDIRIPEAFEKILESGVENEGEDADERYRKLDYAGDFTATSLYRVFKYDWCRGGRIYGGWWMSLPKTIRPYLTINQSPVVELDFRTLHPALLYRRAEADCPNDPYVFDPSGSASINMRKLGKRTFNRLLNRLEADPSKRLHIKAGRGDKDLMPRGLPFKTYLSSFVQNLEKIHPWLGTGMGIQLQYEDSLLALHILKAMEDRGIVVLPIHDSFIVPVHNEEELRSAMENACKKYNLEPRITRTGPS